MTRWSMTAFALLLPAAALANGMVTGTVRADRRPGQLSPIKISKDAAVCGREAAREELRVGPGGGLANVVVSIVDPKPDQRPPPTAGAGVRQIGCRFVPHVQAATVGSVLQLLNQDAVLHNVHATRGTAGSRTTVFNVAMPLKGQTLPAVLDRPGTLKLRCDAGHAWMSAWVHVFDHPHFAVTDEKGRFAIPDVPPGKHTLLYWHEALADGQPPLTISATVEVIDRKTAVSDATIAF